MKLLLINPPNGFLDRTYLAPPLGLLTLASVARQNGFDVSVLDLNLEVIANPKLGGERFYDFAVSRISDLKPEAVGFTSMCLESHVSLEIARRVKQSLPRVVTIFGGTHFGAIARETLTLFPFVDFVVIGEGEGALSAILSRLSGGEAILPGNVLYREEQKIIAGRGKQTSLPLDDLPFPAYDLVDLERYFSLNPVRLLNYEAGRGCVFKCTFCYSPFQYGDAVRNKRPENVLRDMRKLSGLGARHLFFVQDNLLNSPRWATGLCKHLAEARVPLTWECYATYPQLSEPIIDSLSEAGCIGIFTGIDAVALDSQVRMNKPFLKNWEATGRKLTHCLGRGILPICALILEGPDQKPESVNAAVNTAIECVRLGCEIHINTLSIYNNTALAVNNTSPTHSYSSLKPELLLDTPDFVQRNALAKEFTSLFPYHSTHYDVREWEIFIAKAYTLFALILAFPRTMSQYALEEGQSVWATLDYIDTDFINWLRGKNVGERRLLALLKFSKHFASCPLSEDTNDTFRRELVSMVLSYQQMVSKRSVSIIVNGEVRRAELAWFLNLSKLAKSHSGIKSFVVKLLSGSRFNGLPLQIDLTDSENHLARLSRRKSILVISPELDLIRVLSRLERTATSGKAMRLGMDQVKRLEREEWIRLLEPEDDAFPRLDTVGKSG